MRRRSSLLVALVIGSAPGFLLPFVLAVGSGVEVSDAFFLAFSASQVLVGIIGGTYESALVAAVGRHDALGGTMPLGVVFRLMRRGISMAILPTIVIFPLVIAIYAYAGVSAGHVNVRDVVAAAIPLAAVPLVASGASAVSGPLIARGRLGDVLASSLFRGLPTLIAAALNAGLVILACSYLAGELARVVLLVIRYRKVAHFDRTIASASVDFVVPTIRSLGHQTLSSALTQFTPVIVRAILAGSFPGAVSAGEIANRIYSVGVQVANSVVVLPAVVALPASLIERKAAEVKTELRSFIWGVGWRTAALALAMCAAVLGVAVLPLIASRDVIETGLHWGLVLIPAVILTSISSAAARSLVLGGLSRLLPIVSLGSVCVVVLLCLVLVLLIGPVGAVLAMTGGQAFAAAGAVFFSLRSAVAPLVVSFSRPSGVGVPGARDGGQA